MPNTKNLTLDESFRLLLFGQYKTGKTECALTFPRPNVLDFDAGTWTARNPGFVQRWGLRDVLFERFPGQYNTRGVAVSFDPFDKACRYFDACMSQSTVMWESYDGNKYPVNKDMFDTWILDSATTATELALSKAIILLGRPNADKELGQRSGTHNAALKFGLVIPKIQDYGAERSMIEQLVQMIKDSGKMFVLVCHEGEKRGKPEMPGVPGPVEAYVPLLTGRSVQAIPLMFDEVYNSRTRPKGTATEYYLQTTPDGLRACGSRLGIPNEIPNNWDSIKAALDSIRAAQTQQAASAAGGLQ